MFILNLNSKSNMFFFVYLLTFLTKFKYLMCPIQIIFLYIEKKVYCVGGTRLFFDI